jgi:hypothetical protein
MPVPDRPVSEMTKRTGNEPYACQSSVRKDGYWVKEREYKPDGRYDYVDRYIEDVTTKTCQQFELRKIDLRCANCPKE